jgi:hypothetical protein
MLIYLKYSNDNWSTDHAETFNAVEVRPLVETERIKGKSLRGVLYSHLNYSRSNSVLVTISSDELYVATKKDFIKDFYIARAWKYSLDNWTTSVEVDLSEQGNLPYQYLEDNVNLPEVTFNLIQKYPD